MKKSYFLLNLLLILPLLTGCNSQNEKQEEEIIFNLADPLSTYINLNKKYNALDFNYYSESDYLLTSKRGNSQILKSYKIKNNNKIYHQKSSKSELFATKSLQRYLDLNNLNEYGVSEGSSIYNDENTLTSTSYNGINILDDASYFLNYGETLNSLTNFLIYEEYEKSSFKNYEILKEDNNEITYFYNLNLESIKKDEEDTDNNYISNFLSINALKREEKEILSFTDFTTLIINEANFTLTLNKNDLEIKNIEVNEKIILDTIEFDYTYKANFVSINNKNDELNPFFNNLITTVDQNIELALSNKKDELYMFYVDLNKKYQSLNYYTITDSSVMALGGIYDQVVKGFKYKNNDEYFFQTVTASSFVKKAELRYENHLKNEYKIASGENPNSSSLIGSVSSWNKWEDLSQSEYLSLLGHEMNDITNFIVDENNPSSSFINASYSLNEDFYIYKYDISLKEDENHIDASKNYKVEMAHMSNMGEPEFNYSSIEIYINKSDESINKIVQKESYKTMGLECESTMNTYFYLYDSVNEVPSEITSLYNELIKGE